MDFDSSINPGDLILLEQKFKEKICLYSKSQENYIMSDSTNDFFVKNSESCRLLAFLLKIDSLSCQLLTAQGCEFSIHEFNKVLYNKTIYFIDIKDTNDPRRII